MKSTVSTDTLAPQIDTVFQSMFHDNEPGACVIVVKDGKICYDKSFGLADIDKATPITDTTSFNICSVSKQFTAAGILMLAENGLLSVNDPVSKYFPKFKAPFFNDITLANLMSHTSGIPDARPRTPEQWAAYTAIHPTRFKTLADYKLFCEEDESLRYLESLDTLVFEPGTAYEYQNPTYQMLGRVIEIVSGQDLDTWMEQNIFKRAGMQSAVYHSPDHKIENMAHAYSADRSGVWHQDDYGFANFFGTKADGGIYVTPLDFVKWDAALFSDSILSRESRQLAHTPKTDTDIPDTAYGFGWFIENRPLFPEKIYHTGDNGGFFIYEGRYDSADLFYLIFANRADWSREETSAKLDSIFKANNMI